MAVVGREVLPLEVAPDEVVLVGLRAAVLLLVPLGGHEHVGVALGVQVAGLQGGDGDYVGSVVVEDGHRLVDAVRPVHRLVVYLEQLFKHSFV